jgi:hypothetical protein
MQAMLMHLGLSEVAAHESISLILANREYWIRIFGVPIEDPANVLVDNDTVVKKSSFLHLHYRRNIIQYVITL